jgi:tetratricopeptide (TPR) repeat protein
VFGRRLTVIEEYPVQIEKMLMAADGYMDLNMYAEARKELLQIPTVYRNHKLYLWLMNRLSVETEDWEMAVTISRTLCEKQPDLVDSWVAYAYAVRRHEKISNARTILLQAIERFSEEAIIPYNLACYECQLGNIENAKIYLKRALSLDMGFRVIALKDEDLISLREEIKLW